MDKKSVFEKLSEDGVPGAKRMHELLETASSQRDWVLFHNFLMTWMKWEKTLKEEDREKMYDLMDDEMVQISAELQNRPMDSRKLVKKCLRLYNKMDYQQ